MHYSYKSNVAVSLEQNGFASYTVSVPVAINCLPLTQTQTYQTGKDWSREPPRKKRER